MSASQKTLVRKLEDRSATVGVIGLGYVGLPLLVEFARAGFSAIGFDIDAAKVEQIGRGESYIPDVSSDDLAPAVRDGRLLATTDLRRLSEVDTVNICVPTPLRKTKDPDLSFVAAAAESVAKHLHAGQLVILESTTYPGTTEEVVQPMLERGGLKVGRDFCLAFSPERVDPGNAEWRTANIPKVVGGVDPESTEAAAALYQQIVETVVPVSSTRVAEMVKLLENTFRAVNIGLVNELALMCHDLGVNVWEVIDAAKTKPFGFMPFYPGPGLGGHCIPIDPFYLSWKARQKGFESRFIELAGHINATMPRYVLKRVSDALNTVGKPLKGSRIHLFGVAYKADVNDVRESPAIDLAQLLHERGAVLSYSDPYVPQLSVGSLQIDATDSRNAFGLGLDCTIITTPHSAFDYDAIVKGSPLVVDTRNALKGRSEPHIVRL
ncbi:MAG: nucleotide sugar dehydrogenase [Vicinamibacterales bacterium]|nr:UDP-N-acetyl-D-glucosamine dehydrogenase [Acidobacteriota bacterium]MDP6371641.1 nucleotide sugar dehydrogenase [Vicinamibacterales bacterium]MDP6607568.1 nucleotide sugar dehydrogenase [Vicinamibacterales bacterium]HAK54641.1 UDP-N-acetyl-D-glucosamine dehydrogenase [Acidobacteriota bacterium]